MQTEFLFYAMTKNNKNKNSYSYGMEIQEHIDSRLDA